MSPAISPRDHVVILTPTPVKSIKTIEKIDNRPVEFLDKKRALDSTEKIVSEGFPDEKRNLGFPEKKRRKVENGRSSSVNNSDETKDIPAANIVAKKSDSKALPTAILKPAEKDEGSNKSAKAGSGASAKRQSRRSVTLENPPDRPKSRSRDPSASSESSAGLATSERRFSERRFQGEKPYICNHCPLTFSSLDNRSKAGKGTLGFRLIWLFRTASFFILFAYELRIIKREKNEIKVLYLVNIPSKRGRFLLNHTSKIF